MIAMIRHELLGGKTPKSVSERTGFASAGQDAEIKVDAFNFNRYGLIEGKVVSISSDAIIRDKPPDKNNETSEPANQELSYAARVSLARTRMEIEDKAVDTSPA
jgi:hemolysin D